MSHVHPTIEQLLDQPDEVRINKIMNDKWIGYPRAKKIMNKLEDLLQHPKTIRMPNLLIVGDTNNGKTLLVNKFFTAHKPSITDTDEKLNTDVLYVQAPHKPDEKMFFNNLLDVLYVPYRINDRIERKQQQVIKIMRHIEVKMLIIDEIHHVLAGSATAQRTFLNLIKFLANELQIVIVAVGIKDAFNVINSDPQLANRFEPVILPKWSMDDEYLRLLASFEYTLPLKNPSLLSDHKLAAQIMAMSEGTIGEIAHVLRKAAVVAIETKTEQITKKILDSIDYTSPSERKTKINFV